MESPHYDLYLPMRCYTCNRCLSQYQIMMEGRYNQGETLKEIMDSIKPDLKLCCRSNCMNPSTYAIHVKVNPTSTIYSNNPNIFIKRWNDDTSVMSPEERDKIKEKRGYLAR